MRCRNKGLANAEFDFLAFCVYDSIRPSVAGELSDFSFVEIKSRKSAFNTLLALHVRAWYPKPIVAFLLETSAITWGDITYSLQATGHIPRRAFAEALRQMEEAWSEDNALAKSSVNQMVGLMCKNNAVFYSVKSSHDSIDGIGSSHS